MDSFLTRYYTAVRDHLHDPSITRKYTEAKLLRDLTVVEASVWEDLMAITGQESLVGRVDTIIALEDGVDFVTLPGNFRQFMDFQKFGSSSATSVGDRNVIENSMGTLTEYEVGPGVQIISGQRGMRLKPVPSITETQYWTLTYLKGPVTLHNATTPVVASPQSAAVIEDPGYVLTTPVGGTMRITQATKFTTFLLGESVALTVAAGTDQSETITAANADYIEFDTVTGLTDDDTFTFDTDWSWLVTGTPGTDDGTLIKLPDYYNGSMIAVYDGTLYVPQTKECLDYALDAGGGTTAAAWHMKLRFNWPNIPTGVVKYEVRPALPDPLDEIYSLDTAIRILGRRTRSRGRAMLNQDRKKSWAACARWVTSNASDRPPQRLHKPTFDEPEPYDY